MQAKLTKIYALSGFGGMSYTEFDSVVKQTLEKPDCYDVVVFLDINEIYSVYDLQSDGAKQVLYQKLTSRR